ncbi:Mutated LacI family transcriptional regulator (plasmid) [Sinorhizobium meliloti 1021]|uniref:Mutated LacI family transcriptional regulator n=1 Tax=Rhizobium meliloti (strain 1021) TaxID=266834 RepID=B2FDE0_RHIME|nr:Mutated LacI family transcriptional regulator [Sinorhizobium meliloti 1021]
MSVSTVSKALNDNGRMAADTRERIKNLAAEIGFRPNALARGLLSNRSFTVGLRDERHLWALHAAGHGRGFGSTGGSWSIGLPVRHRGRPGAWENSCRRHAGQAGGRHHRDRQAGRQVSPGRSRRPAGAGRLCFHQGRARQRDADLGRRSRCEAGGGAAEEDGPHAAVAHHGPAGIHLRGRARRGISGRCGRWGAGPAWSLVGGLGSRGDRPHLECGRRKARRHLLRQRPDRPGRGRCAARTRREGAGGCLRHRFRQLGDHGGADAAAADDRRHEPEGAWAGGRADGARACGGPDDRARPAQAALQACRPGLLRRRGTTELIEEMGFTRGGPAFGRNAKCSRN